MTANIDFDRFAGKIAGGPTHTIVVTDNGRAAYSFGSNMGGQLGRDVIDNFWKYNPRDRPAEIDLPDIIIKSVACGRDHNIFVTHDGRVFSFGNKYEDNTIGRVSDTEHPADRPGEIILPVKISTAACGKNYTILVSEDGLHVYSFGDYGYPHLLGRTVDAEHPVGIPAEI